MDEFRQFFLFRHQQLQFFTDAGVPCLHLKYLLVKRNEHVAEENVGNALDFP
jgi:hypothetical protein